MRIPSSWARWIGSVVALGTCGLGGCADAPSDPPACGSGKCPGAPGSPSFSGVASVAPDRTGAHLRVTWSPATDDGTAPEQLRYRVYVSTKAGRATAREPVLTSEPGATSAYVSVLPLGVMHHVVVRAVDADGLEDANVLEKSTLAAPDTTPPVFDGPASLRPEPDAAVTVSWNAAIDDRTPAEGMRYAVLDARTSMLLAMVEGTTTTLRNLGAPGDHRSFRVRALDAADNVDANTKIVEGVLGPDATAPSFAGCGAIEAGSKSLHVSWAEAKDDASAPRDITYDVYVSKVGMPPSFSAPAASAVGRSEAIVGGLEPSTRYSVVCRARDARGNSDTNTLAKEVTTTANVTAPKFEGATGTIDPSRRRVTLTWSAASDDMTPASGIVYVVYETRGSTPFDFSRPLLMSAPGATSIAVDGLASRAELHWVVRARDRDWNEDANVRRVDGTTNTSWSLDVVPLFRENCAVVGCHAAPNAGEAIPFSLSPFNAYESIVDVASTQRPLLKRVAPGSAQTSYLYQKITDQPTILNDPMPAPGTGNVLTAEQVDVIESWIDEGAARN